MPDEDAYWAVVELMGHVKMAGLLTQEERFGAMMGRLDIPHEGSPCQECGGSGEVRKADGKPRARMKKCPACKGTGGEPAGFTTTHFSGAAVYRITPVAEEIARKVARACCARPISPLQLPAPGSRDYDDEDYDS